MKPEIKWSMSTRQAGLEDAAQVLRQSVSGDDRPESGDLLFLRDYGCVCRFVFWESRHHLVPALRGSADAGVSESDCPANTAAACLSRFSGARWLGMAYVCVTPFAFCALVLCATLRDWPAFPGQLLVVGAVVASGVSLYFSRRRIAASPGVTDGVRQP